MKYYKQLASSSFAAAIIALSAAPAMAQSTLDIRQTANEINAANTLLREGKVDEALDAYRKIAPVDQQRDELNYNRAVAEYRKGNIEAAEGLFTDVVGTGSPTIAADSHYNLGNCKYAKALQLTEKDKPAAMELLRKAIASYRGSLRGKPNNPDARANIELAGELIRTLEQEQKKKEQQQKQDDQQQQNEDKQQDQQNKDQQKQDDQKQQGKSQDSESQKDDSQKDSGQQESDSQDSKSDQEKNEELMDQEQKKQDEQSAAEQPQEKEQKNDDQKENKAGDKEQENDQQKPTEQQSQSKRSDSMQKQQKSGDQQTPEGEDTPEEQDAKHKSVPTGDLKAASEQEQNRQPEDSVGTADQDGKDGLITREEALKMLQSVRDRDMLRRMQQQRQERSRRVRVEKDW